MRFAAAVLVASRALASLLSNSFKARISTSEADPWHTAATASSN